MGWLLVCYVVVIAAIVMPYCEDCHCLGISIAVMVLVLSSLLPLFSPCHSDIDVIVIIVPADAVVQGLLLSSSSDVCHMTLFILLLLGWLLVLLHHCNGCCCCTSILVTAGAGFKVGWVVGPPP